MRIFFEPKINLPAGASAPDLYDESWGNSPPDNFIVSRNRDGTVASTFGELSWNQSAYHPEGKARWLYFSYWGKQPITAVREQLSREARWLIVVLIWLREGPPLSIGTLLNYLTVIKALAKFSEASGCRIQDTLGNVLLLVTFVEKQCSGWKIETLGSMLPLLAKVGHNRLGFTIVSDKLLSELRHRGQQYRGTLKQHIPIPTRIYSSIISNLTRELDDWMEVESGFLSLLTSCAKDPLMGRTRGQQTLIAKKLKLTFQRAWRPEFEALASTSIKTYLDTKGQHKHVKGLSVAITEILIVIKLIIQTYTGMREDEALSLPYHCIETTVTNGKTHYIVLGRTTKHNKSRVKRTRWVTNREGYRAIQCAQRIAHTIYSVFNIEPKKDSTRTNEYPLFVSPAYLGLSSKSFYPEHKKLFSLEMQLSQLEKLRTRIQPLIEDCDLRELEQIDPHRAWRSEENLQIGNPWILKSHQLRRSLALYAQRSGLVSLPSLRRQLQHITEEMSRYYARGSVFAKNFIGDDKEHFGLEWQQTQPFSAALSYVVNVLLSDDVLFGGHFNWIEHRLKSQDGIILVDREATFRRFKKGELSYRETLIGGCTKIGECNQTALKWMNIDCISQGCRNMVGNLTKLELVIKAQESFVMSLDPESVEFRTEKADLNILVAARNKVLLNQNGEGI